MPNLPLFKAWNSAKVLTTKEVIKRYENGFSGCGLDLREAARLKDKLHSSVKYAYGSDVCTALGYADSAKGELVIPFVYVLEQYPKAWPGPGQERGDCVSHGGKNANLGSMVLESVLGLPDPVSGKVEECPSVSAAGEKNGVLSTEALYWHRGSNSDGWYCAAVADVSRTEAGAVLRQNYPDAGIDLTEYSGGLAGKYGRTAPSGIVSDVLDDHLFREATEVDSPEAARDLLSRGFFINTCGSEGLGKKRDENGVSRRSGSWAHSMAEIAFDDRPWAHQKYGGPLELILNSWSVWNSGPRDIFDSAQYVPSEKKQDWITKDIVNPDTGNIMIPRGSCWVPCKDLTRRDRYAMGGCNGWERKSLTDMLGGWT
jgi:hypothetical protein